MPRHAAPLECSVEVRSELTAMSRSRKEETRMVERARILLACLEGKEIQQVAQDGVGRRALRTITIRRLFSTTPGP